MQAPIRIALGIALFFTSGCQGGGDSNSSATLQQFDCTSESTSQEEIPLEDTEDFAALEEKILSAGQTPKVIGKAEFPTVAVTADCGSTVQIEFTSDTDSFDNSSSTTE